MSSLPPSPDELRAYCAGSLPAERFAAIDGWLAGLPEDEVERLLAAAGIADAAGSLGAVRAVGAAAATAPGFSTDLPRSRLRPGTALGSGGMAVVGSAHDRVLDRTVAVKVLRARRPDESLEHYHLREAAFRREAALTASLEHPAIPPVYDIGTDGGLPAFAMKRLDGRSLEAAIKKGDIPLADRLGILLRVAEAVGYAHSRGIVHRDLTPQNILISTFGAVYVLDWGLAATIGSADGVRAGTPAWMAPEQVRAAAVDPRMDVFGLGAVICFAITGRGPRPDPARPEHLDLSALIDQRVPQGLAALIRRCLTIDPDGRYADGGAVAEDLRRWLAEGVTVAQQASRWELAWLRLRRSPRALAGALSGVVVVVLAVGVWQVQAWRDLRAAEARLDQIAATTALDRAETVALALDEVRAIRARLPHLAAAQAAEARLQTAHDLAARTEHLDQVAARIDGLLHRTRTLGPWADQVQAWRAAIREAGLTMDTDRIDEDARRLLLHPLRAQIIASLPFLWRAEKERGADHHATCTARLLALAGTSPGWQALGRLLNRSQFAAHDPVFCDCPDAAGVLVEPEPTAVALALFASEPRLAAAARDALGQQPGAFWPLVASSRASLTAGDEHTAERLALVASGAEPDSLLPPLLLAYVAVQRHDRPALEQAVARGLAIAPGNAELTVLNAVATVWSGHLASAQAMVDRMDAGHLQYHLHHAVGHPMERSVRALVAAGVRIPDAPAIIGPLAPAP